MGRNNIPTIHPDLPIRLTLAIALATVIAVFTMGYNVRGVKSETEAANVKIHTVESNAIERDQATNQRLTDAIASLTAGQDKTNKLLFDILIEQRKGSK